jgi:hypothetical protein
MPAELILPGVSLVSVSETKPLKNLHEICRPDRRCGACSNILNFLVKIAAIACAAD